MQSTLTETMEGSDAELSKILTLVKIFPIAKCVRIKRLSQSDVLRHAQKNHKESHSTATSKDAKVKVKSSASHEELLKKSRLEKIKKMEEVLARDQQRNNPNGANKSYNFNYSAKTPSSQMKPEAEENDGSVGELAKLGIKTPGGNDKSDFNVGQLLKDPFKTPMPFRIPKSRVPPTTSPASPATSTLTSRATCTATSPATVSAAAKPEPSPQPPESPCADPNLSSVEIPEDASLGVPLPSHLKNKKACWFCPICDHYDDKEEHSQRSVENHINEK
jgi:hypothetical protein